MVKIKLHISLAEPAIALILPHMGRGIRKHWLLAVIAVLGLLLSAFSLFGGDPLINLLSGLCPFCAAWVVDNPYSFLVIWVELALIVWLLQLYGGARVENLKLTGSDPDLPMNDAIARIRDRNKVWRAASDEAIVEAILDLALRGRITVWAKVHESLDVPLIEIPQLFFYSAFGGPYEDGGYMLQSFARHPAMEGSWLYRHIYNVTLNQGQIDARFSKLKPQTE